jgi:hypothetical protein
MHDKVAVHGLNCLYLITGIKEEDSKQSRDEGCAVQGRLTKPGEETP